MSKDINCLYCQKPLQKVLAGVYGENRFCSKEHRQRYKSGVKFEFMNNRFCKFCKTKIDPERRENTLYCNRKCAKENYLNEYHKTSKFGKKERVLNCKNCGKLIEGRTNVASFCDIACQKFWAGRRRSGDDLTKYVKMRKIVLDNRTQEEKAIEGLAKGGYSSSNMVLAYIFFGDLVARDFYEYY